MGYTPAVYDLKLIGITINYQFSLKYSTVFLIADNGIEVQYGFSVRR